MLPVEPEQRDDKAEEMAADEAVDDEAEDGENSWVAVRRLVLQEASWVFESRATRKEVHAEEMPEEGM